ncbi:hypothetical protein ARAM_003129 [Aspergillus rambellii]|uniref:Elongator complex protein 2 n=1 Tax=Aspergillus rambellii TaxID=308745 RepID=A0A0F8WPT2_9EURO|nr:hypothetical protein ARAM_003129 [Aspergillus rambellii]
MDTLLTADIVASSPRFRRKSSTFVDAIHDLPEKADLAPAQLYSTESGRLFHSGRIVIITVGLPARGKTHMSVAMARYLRWLGVKTRIFHLGDYRRATIPYGQDIPDDYFFVNASASSVLLRQKIVKRCREDIYRFLNEENGQIAIYDAVNPSAAGRRSLANEFAKHEFETLFIESWCDDSRIIEENVRRVKISSPDVSIIIAKAAELSSSHTDSVAAGVSVDANSYKADGPLSEKGEDYAKKMTEILLKHRESEKQAMVDQAEPDYALKPLTVWTSTRRRTVETAKYLHEKGYKVRQRSQLSQLNPGVCEMKSERRIRQEYPEEVAKHELDPYHHRYPRAESYHDLAVRLEPIILELEREQNDLLIIAHESVLRVLYGYLMACNAADIPFLEFPRDEIIEIIPESYQNEARRIHVPGLPNEIIPGSPEDIKIPVIDEVLEKEGEVWSAAVAQLSRQIGFKSAYFMVSITAEYISVGGNRHPAAADWDVQSGVLAYGADNNVALWEPRDASNRGVYSVLVGHTEKVNVVRFYTCPTTGTKLLLTGAVDHTVRIWQADQSDPKRFAPVLTLEGHTGSVNAIATTAGADVIATGAADGTVIIWRVTVGESVKADLLETIPMKPRYFPLALALALLPTESQDRPMALAVAGTTNVVQVYAAESTITTTNFKISATLSGHEAWVRSLSFTADKGNKAGDLLLASASQDKYVRLWRFNRGEVSRPSVGDDADAVLGGLEPTLSNKAHQFGAAGSKYSVTFEALLFGNEDWVYTTAWNPNPERQQLLTASADNTLTIWEQDPVSGVWLSAERMGEISVQKGSTTATGSTGGFWIGLWSPDGNQVVSLGRTGSWRAWRYEAEMDVWVQILGITGHVRSANGIQWEPSGGYLLSTSADQTTRLHAQWNRHGIKSWHEFSRPQIHGYDLNCVDTLGPTRFVSGAEEKLLRVFNEPKPIAQLLERLCGFHQSPEGDLPDTAHIPVLGLSNQAVGEQAPADADVVDSVDVGQAHANQEILSNSTQPPLEDQLARYTLWPEHEKLYGHGYEISAVAVSHDRTLIATACKASSIDHAVVRLYDTSDWHEIRPSLAAHTLTITDLCFSTDDKYLLSVGRDRQWAVYRRSESDPSTFALMTSNPRGHSRMILDADWAPMLENQPPIFATAGRDNLMNVELLKMLNPDLIC